MLKFKFAVVQLGVTLVLATAAQANIHHVPGDYPTIQQAIDAAESGDEIVVAPGTYHETLIIEGKSLMLRSSRGRDVTIIDALKQGTVITITGESSQQTVNLVIDGFTITGGAGLLPFEGGGGLRTTGSFGIQSSVTILDCHFSGNIAHSGGAIATNLKLIITDSKFSDNEATGMFGTGGAVRYSGLNSSFTATSTVFVNNSATSQGGAIKLWESGNATTIEDCLFIANTAVAGGALHATAWSWTTLQGCEFEGNAAQSGGAVFAQSDPSWGDMAVVECIACHFNENTAVNDGGAFANGCGTDEHSQTTCGRGIFTNCTFEGNSAGKHGGAIRNACIIWNVCDDKSGDCDWVTTCHPPTISGSTFTGNTAGIAGGAVATTSSAPIAAPPISDAVFCANAPTHIFGPWTNLGSNQFGVDCPVGDLTGDGFVGLPDLLIMLGAWGDCATCDDCPADLTGNCSVGVLDLLILLANWG